MQPNENATIGQPEAPRANAQREPFSLRVAYANVLRMVLDDPQMHSGLVPLREKREWVAFYFQAYLKYVDTGDWRDLGHMPPEECVENHYFFEINGLSAGGAGLEGDGPYLVCSQFWSAEENMGLGRPIMQAIQAHATDIQKPIILCCSGKVRGFYEKMGFTCLGLLSEVQQSSTLLPKAFGYNTVEEKRDPYVMVWEPKKPYSEAPC